MGLRRTTDGTPKPANIESQLRVDGRVSRRRGPYAVAARRIECDYAVSRDKAGYL